MGAQAHILALVANGKAQLVVRHGHAAALGFAGQQLHLDNLCRGQSCGDELVDVLAPADDIDLFAAQLFHDLFHAGAMGADAGTDGVNIGVLAPHSHLGAGTSLTADGLYLHSAVIDFGHFQLKHALDQAGMGAADGHAGAALGCQNIDHINLDHLAFGKVFAGHLLVFGQNSAAALAEIQHDVAALCIHSGNGAGLVCTGLHLAALQAALAFAQALADHMLCGLGGNAAKLFGLEGGNKALAHFIGLADLLGIFQADLGVGVLNFLHNVLQKACAECADVGVDIHNDIIVLDLIVLFDSNDNGGLDLIDQVVCRQSAFLFQCGQCVKKFVVIRCHVSPPFNIAQNKSSSSHSFTYPAAFTGKV